MCLNAFTSPTPKEVHQSQVSDNKVLRKIFAPKDEESNVGHYTIRYWSRGILRKYVVRTEKIRSTYAYRTVV
jgi:hypothetical protein